MPYAKSCSSVICPEEFELIVRVFRLLCEAANVELESDLALRLAAQTLAGFQSGNRSAEQLLEAVALSVEYQEAILELGSKCSRSFASNQSENN